MALGIRQDAAARGISEATLRRHRPYVGYAVIPVPAEVVAYETRGPACRAGEIAVAAAAAEREASGERLAAAKESGLRP